ncbi:hypothetical protein [Liquorilactobacillus hordei]|uniref:hypothetical protein n=1 Tax=Liquorilactobacillus hordei TaxID=468911 RepID=UPI0039EB0516
MAKRLSKEELQKQLGEYEKEEKEQQHKELLERYKPISDEELQEQLMKFGIGIFEDGYENWEFGSEEQPYLMHDLVCNKKFREELRHNEYLSKESQEMVRTADEAYEFYTNKKIKKR